MKKKNLIAHRGNLFGPNPERENNPSSLLFALERGYSVEADVRLYNGLLRLGHDAPQYPFCVENFEPTRTYWHCKTVPTLLYFDHHYPRALFFYQEEDDIARINCGEYWLHSRCSSWYTDPDCIHTVLGYDPVAAKGGFRICTDFAAWYAGMPKLLILDVDGVMTTGMKGYGEQHTPTEKPFSDQDFTAIKRFVSNGVPVVFLSGDRRINEAMAWARGIPFFFGRKDGQMNKPAVLETILKRYAVTADEVGYIGDDYYDIDVLRSVGWGFCPSDAIAEVKRVAYPLSRPGGHGVVAELAGLYSDLLPRYPEEIERINYG